MMNDDELIAGLVDGITLAATQDDMDAIAEMVVSLRNGTMLIDEEGQLIPADDAWLAQAVADGMAVVMGCQVHYMGSVEQWQQYPQAF